MVADSPGAGAEGDLEQGMAVEEADDGYQQSEREGMMCGRFVGLVESMGFGELLLMMDKLLLLVFVEYGELVLLFRPFFEIFGLFGTDGGEVVVILKLREGFLTSESPG